MFLVVPVAAIVSATWRLVVATIEDDAPEARSRPTSAAARADPARPRHGRPVTAPASAGT